MRPAGNFNPEWGYLAPVPGFMRTLRIALVAGTVGASAGAAVVFSLVDRPAAEESVASRTLVRATPAASIPVAVAPAPSASDAPAAPVSISAPLALANASNPSPAVNQSPAVNPSAAADERSASAPASHPANAAAALAEIDADQRYGPGPGCRAGGQGHGDVAGVRTKEAGQTGPRHAAIRLERDVCAAAVRRGEGSGRRLLRPSQRILGRRMFGGTAAFAIWILFGNVTLSAKVKAPPAEQGGRCRAVKRQTLSGC